MSPLLTVPEAAAVLRCSLRRVFQLLEEGTLTRGPKYGRRTTITAESIEAAGTVEETEKRRRFRTRSTAADWDALFQRHG